jgi:hypothetical protein
LARPDTGAVFMYRVRTQDSRIGCGPAWRCEPIQTLWDCSRSSPFGLPSSRSPRTARNPVHEAPFCRFVTQLLPKPRPRGAVLSLCYTTLPETPSPRRRSVILLHNSSQNPVPAAPFCHFVTQLLPKPRPCGAALSFCYTTLPETPSPRRRSVILLHNSSQNPVPAAPFCHFVTQLLPKLRIRDARPLSGTFAAQALPHPSCKSRIASGETRSL